MAKKSSGSALGLLLLFAPVAWVCSMCTGNDRPPQPLNASPIESPSSPAPAPMHAEPVVPLAEPAPEPAPHHAKHRAHAKRVHHDEPGTPPDPTAADLDRALKDALAEPSSTPERRRPPSSTADAPSSTTCCKHCGPSSKPCGDSCISLSKTCHKGRGCAC